MPSVKQFSFKPCKHNQMCYFAEAVYIFHDTFFHVPHWLTHFLGFGGMEGMGQELETGAQTGTRRTDRGVVMGQ
jgi:hypothetical protein